MLAFCHSMAASRSTRVTRSTVGLNGLDEAFCGRTLRNRSIAHQEEIVALPLVRSKSPKKRPESVQTFKGANGGRSVDLKQQSPSDSWASPRKRGLSLSEKDSTEKDTVENCETKDEESGSPVLKRARRCLRSDTLNSLEEESVSNVVHELSERKSFVSENDTDSPGTKQARRCLLLDDCDEREIKNVNACDEGLNDSALVESTEIAHYETVNGVAEEEVAALNCDDCHPDSDVIQDAVVGPCLPNEHMVAENGNVCHHSSLLLNKVKEDTVSDHNVPCANSQEQVELKDHELTNDILPCEHVTQAKEPGAVHASDLKQSIRDSEDEVDVVGDGANSREPCTGNSNLNKDYACSLISGETEPPSGRDTLSAQMSYSVEHEEHGYTRRPSPTRVILPIESPQKSISLSKENGEMECVIARSTDINVPKNMCITDSLERSLPATETDKANGCDPQMSVENELRKPPMEEKVVSGSALPVVESGCLQLADEEEEDPDVYYFESDHVALKHNKDYQRLLQTIAVLEAQRTQAVQDLENLGRHQNEALKDPIRFVERLQKKVDIGLPCPQRVVQLPDIAWDQYTSSLGNFEREFQNRKRPSRRAKLTFDKGLPVRPKSPMELTKDGESPSYSVLPLSDGPEGSTSHSQQLIRGRLCDESKPETFNQLWTVEEQKRLEQLLLKFPPEEVESRRWQKIADSLGNRTAKQVASRVQKYFIKLAKAGIPIPGRTPNVYLCSKKSTGKRQHPLNKHLFKPSTFMTSHEPPVYMDEDSQSSYHSRDLDALLEEDVSDEDNLPLACRESAEYKELLALKKLKKKKLLQMNAEGGFVHHVGFKCDNCGTEPIQGVRWHCQDCPLGMAVDFCDSCSDCLHETATHKEDHHLEPVYRVETFLDRDYCMAQGTSYNYLDPNYFPANR
ncbi:ZZ-type zinc finger-containing protein 3 isoform X2 [Ambystoma mexicanum]|uniref:ZZ-type zinc finger-containing protein 3 isoform X2 n=1 Tax=Ambystoma mexicanum TaxID=8296 RepID=UPI0037E807B9